MYECMCTWRSGVNVRCHLLPWFLRQGLSLNLELTDVAKFEGQRAPGVCWSLWAWGLLWLVSGPMAHDTGSFCLLSSGTLSYCSGCDFLKPPFEGHHVRALQWAVPAFQISLQGYGHKRCHLRSLQSVCQLNIIDSLTYSS